MTVPVRRAFVALVACLAAACTGGGPTVTGSPPASPTFPSPTGSDVGHTPAPERPPNVLIVLTDDQRADTLGVMPQVRRLFGGGGIEYANGFVTTPLCCPSRATIMTGRFPHDTGVLGNGDALKLDHDTTVQRYLHDAGYRTGMVGKFLNDWPVGTAPPNFDRWALFSSGYLGGTFDVDGRVRRVNEYSTTFIGDQAVRFLRDFASEPDRPWFLYVATAAPHDPWIPEPKYANAPVPPFVKDPAMRETDTIDKPQWVRDALHLTDEKIELDRAQQLRTLMSVDDMVGRLFRTLRALGQDRDTLAFFLSDNPDPAAGPVVGALPAGTGGPDPRHHGRPRADHPGRGRRGAPHGPPDGRPLPGTGRGRGDRRGRDPAGPDGGLPRVPPGPDLPERPLVVLDRLAVGAVRGVVRAGREGHLPGVLRSGDGPVPADEPAGRRHGQ